MFAMLFWGPCLSSVASQTLLTWGRQLTLASAAESLARDVIIRVLAQLLLGDS